MYLYCITVGSPKESWSKDASAHYIDRLKKLSTFEILELPASKHKDPQKQSEEESSRILETLVKRKGQIWALDERGKSMTSVAFSGELQKLADLGESITFVIGGAYGFDDRVRDRADVVLSLSQMTMAHELCRVVFLEQLYRAVQIKRGSVYHH